jgi:hypothetical protein
VANNNERSGPSGPSRILIKWSFLLLGIAAIILFVSIIAPAVGQMSRIRVAVTELRESDIEAGAYFYTNVEQVKDAELYISHTFQFSSKTRN